MDSYITWPYQIADHNCRITWVYNNKRGQTPCRDIPVESKNMDLFKETRAIRGLAPFKFFLKFISQKGQISNKNLLTIVAEYFPTEENTFI